MKNNTITIQIPEGKSAEWINGVLTLVDVEDTRPITERVKTYKDACKILGKDPLEKYIDKTVELENGEKFVSYSLPLDEIAYIQLKTIIEALNEGWKPQLTEDEYRWYPWFYLYTKEEIKRKSKADLKRQRGLLLGGGATSGAICGFAYVRSHNTPLITHAYRGSRLCLKSEELADYCGRQFIEIWFAYLFPDHEIKQKDWSE